MKTYKEVDLKNYLEDDWILRLLKSNTFSLEEANIRTSKWLEEIAGKRLIFADVYGDLLKTNQRKKILDVGGGISSLTKLIAENSNYTLLDFLAHGGEEVARELVNKESIQWLPIDWYEFDIKEHYDIIIANDIFPDVDQRMELFLEKFSPHCNELRLVLTYYNDPRFYLTKRTDDSELMTFLSWDGEITALKLLKYISKANCTMDQIEEMKTNHCSIFRNNRQVSYLKLYKE